MRKMLILMLILGVVPVASAVMTLQISVNGVNEPPDSTIFVLPSNTIALDVWTPNGYTAGDEEYWGLVLSDATAGMGTITGGVVHIGPAPNASSMLGDMSQYYPGALGVFGFIGSYDQPSTPAGIYFDEIIFHCVSMQDAVVQLWSTPDSGETFVLEDTVIIHQIVPEPATMVLLGLGGLLFRKRGK